MLVNIAIVEDEEKQASLLKKHIENYFDNIDEKSNISVFNNGFKFLEDFKNNFDIIFMDIEMPHIDGISLCKEIRKYDSDVLIIFVTNMAQFAIKGYEVDALAFLLKPVSSFNLKIYLDKALNLIKKKNQLYILINVEDGVKKISINDIYYIEVNDHMLDYHTTDGVISNRKSLTELEKQLSSHGFVRSNSCYLINLKYVSKVTSKSVFILNQELQLSRQRKKDVMLALTNYLGGQL